MPVRKTQKNAATAPVYSEHPGLKMEAAAARNVLDRTGKSIDDWSQLVQRQRFDSQRAALDWLKQEHGFSTNYAGWIVEKAFGGGEYTPYEYVEQMFAGKKAVLKPLYDRLVELALALGDDVSLTPCQTMVPIRRRYVIAQIKPTTNTRIDLGLALRDTPASGRLIDTGGFKKRDRITHRIEITRLEDIDATVERWLKAAYKMDSPPKTRLAAIPSSAVTRRRRKAGA